MEEVGSTGIVPRKINSKQLPVGGRKACDPKGDLLHEKSCRGRPGC
jgi:hypothetical protein